MPVDAPDLLSGWNQLNVVDRDAILTALVAIVDTKLRESPFYRDDRSARPLVEVYGALQEDRRLTVHFVAHYLMYCYAQSGSDWAEHFILTGGAAFEDGSLVASTVVLVAAPRLAESWVEGYDEKAAVAPIRDAAIAKLRASAQQA